MAARGYGLREAVAWWSLIPLLIYVGLTCLLARRSGLNQASAYIILLALTLPFLSANAMTGQAGTVLAILLLGAACFWRARPILAGICIGLVAIKPQMGLLLPFALAAAGRWRTFAAAALTVLAAIGASFFWLGGAVWGDYLAMTQLFGAFIAAGHPGIRQLALAPYVSLQAAGVPAALAAAAQAVISLTVGIVVTQAFWKADRARMTAGGPALGPVGRRRFARTPYALTYDTRSSSWPSSHC